MNREFLDAIEANPIIAAVKDEQGLANCLRREELTVIFILYGDIRSIGNIVERIHQAGKIAMVHIDLVCFSSEWRCFFQQIWIGAPGHGY